MLESDFDHVQLTCVIVFANNKQMNTIHNVAEERKTLKRSNSISGKLANLSISKKNSPRLQKKNAKKGRTVSFSSSERQELEFDDLISDLDTDLDTSSSEDSMLSEVATPTANRPADTLAVAAASGSGANMQSCTAFDSEKDVQNHLDFKYELHHQHSPTSVCHDDVLAAQ